MNNSIRVIHPYWLEGALVFDDPSVGLDREPFVAGADTVLGILAAAVSPKCAKKFTLYFSDQPFPGHQAALRRLHPEYGGTWYICDELGGMEGWLCPALFKYFEAAPEFLYVQIKEPQS